MTIGCRLTSLTSALHRTWICFRSKASCSNRTTSFPIAFFAANPFVQVRRVPASIAVCSTGKLDVIVGEGFHEDEYQLDLPEGESEVHGFAGDDSRADVRQEGVDRVGDVIWRTSACWAPDQSCTYRRAL